jgi:lipid-binding SYLF domain-containing protein
MGKLMGLFAAASLVAMGCAHAPTKSENRAELVKNAEATVAEMTAKDPALRPLLDQAAGYIVFPIVGQGSFIVGAGAGVGVVYEQGRPVAFAELNKASFGAEAGGQNFSEMIVVRDAAKMNEIKNGNYDVGAEALINVNDRTMVTARSFNQKGIAVFIQNRSGAELKLSLTGQRIKVVF